MLTDRALTYVSINHQKKRNFHARKEDEKDKKKRKKRTYIVCTRRVFCDLNSAGLWEAFSRTFFDWIVVMNYNNLIGCSHGNENKHLKLRIFFRAYIFLFIN